MERINKNSMSGGNYGLNGQVSFGEYDQFLGIGELIDKVFDSPARLERKAARQDRKAARKDLRIDKKQAEVDNKNAETAMMLAMANANSQPASEQGDNSTLILTLGIIGGVIVIGGVVAVIMKGSAKQKIIKRVKSIKRPSVNPKMTVAAA